MGIQANSVLSREGSRYKLPGPGYLAYVLIFSRSVLVEGPEKIVWLGPLPALGVPGPMSTQEQAHCAKIARQEVTFPVQELIFKASCTKRGIITAECTIVIFF